ncbi:formate dehydrogenase [Methanobacterium sp. CWC-01]|jgi:formate dehydrogenase subunit beta|uniref:Coenzyme F420 hydrogenase/dehydrogenase, beta subunit C-terminal domain n=1 Tax=Methanobacterium aridiramus TaxID=2584467 RepID=UPI002577E72A|nr:Coenzyme F420 hydrogenase/dehydrogenase, beta subunit C-terminal domain [Methanobacterium sp. CWC-01]WJI09718.1 formate dehydrogenase [Methanobacterium sp. CWC-01]
MVQVGDMYYAWGSDDEIAASGECGGAVTTILKFLLEDGIVDAVLAVKKGSDLYDAVPTLISDPEKIIETAGSLHCGTLNMAKTLEKYLDGARNMKIAVTAKPCDAMTMVELIKREQIDGDNIIIVGVNCGGTMPPVKAREMIEKFYETDPDAVIKEEIAKGNLIIETAEGEQEISIDELEDQGYGRRTNCRRCEINIPRMADLALGNWGVIGPLAGKATFVEVFSEKGADVLDKAINAGVLNTQEPIPKGVEIRANIDKIMAKLANKWQAKDFDESRGEIMATFAQYLDEFERCIKCYGCRESCPICYCEECTLEVDGPEWLAKGSLPPSPMFHMERLIHMVDSCTNCGQCEEVCPAEIPLAKIWHEINSKIKETYGYQRGVKEGMPPFSYFPLEAGK